MYRNSVVDELTEENNRLKKKLAMEKANQSLTRAQNAQVQFRLREQETAHSVQVLVTGTLLFICILMLVFS